ncbi:hypothetical protein BV25DRAFT_1922325 [Artomyces pyxidatus]|uniref:Uncharacterized protein n=1 Tax=Artomyces pyxidatus TaxID=48021 RepID=A0ACB8SE71_9AGAM|nr:hypothetical protein BV25DRAFT_1922325 [Artomyces pyxidatus]
MAPREKPKDVSDRLNVAQAAQSQGPLVQPNRSRTKAATKAGNNGGAGSAQGRMEGNQRQKAKDKPKSKLQPKPIKMSAKRQPPAPDGDDEDDEDYCEDDNYSDDEDDEDDEDDDAGRKNVEPSAKKATGAAKAKGTIKATMRKNQINEQVSGSRAGKLARGNAKPMDEYEEQDRRPALSGQSKAKAKATPGEGGEGQMPTKDAAAALLEKAFLDEKVPRSWFVKNIKQQDDEAREAELASQPEPSDVVIPPAPTDFRSHVSLQDRHREQVAAAADTTFVGYAFDRLVGEEDKEPEVSYLFGTINNRPIKPTAVHALNSSYVTNGLRMKEHPIPIACSSRRLNFERLREDMDKILVAEWIQPKRGSTAEPVIAFGGQHRKAALKVYVRDDLGQLVAKRAAVARMQASLREGTNVPQDGADRLQRLINEKDAMEKAYVGRTMWVVAVYDLGESACDISRERNSRAASGAVQTRSGRTHFVTRSNNTCP